MTNSLETKLRIDGYELTQIERSGHFAVYAQAQRGTVLSYEVIEIQQRPAQTIMGKSYPEREGYPHKELWGKCAWTCATLARAMERFVALCAHG